MGKAVALRNCEIRCLRHVCRATFVKNHGSTVGQSADDQCLFRRVVVFNCVCKFPALKMRRSVPDLSGGSPVPKWKYAHHLPPSKVPCACHRIFLRAVSGQTWCWEVNIKHTLYDVCTDPRNPRGAPTIYAYAHDTSTLKWRAT